MSDTAPQGGRIRPEIAAVLAYLGGLITGIVMLIVEKDDRFVRFHAMQSTITFFLVAVAHFMLMGVPVLGAALYIPFVVGVAVLWVVLMVEAYNGHRFKLPYIGDFAEQRIR